MERKITPKQLEVLRLLAEGNNSTEIAVMLQNSKKTIDNIRNKMLLNFQLKNVCHLITWGFRNGHLK
jgi:DNA-binding CsgD family transcriptional regulator